MLTGNVNQKMHIHTINSQTQASEKAQLEERGRGETQECGPDSIRFVDFTRVQDAYWQCDQKDAHPHNKPSTQVSKKAQPEERGRGEAQE